MTRSTLAGLGLAAVLLSSLTSATKAQTPWSTVDAAVDWGNGKIYFFKGNQYLAYNKETEAVLPGYPLTIASAWRGVVFDRIDAAIMWPGGRSAYLFSGDEYCRYNVAADKVDPGFERLKIKDHWKGVPFNKIDGALLWPDGKYVYLFSGDEYCRFNVAADKVDPGFERLKISANWKGLFPSGVRAPLVWGTARDKVYFFSGSQYTRYDVRADRVDEGYPRQTAQGWDLQAPNQMPPLGYSNDMKYKKVSNPADPGSPYVWNPTSNGRATPGSITRTIYSILDKQPLLTYTSNFPPRDSDGCSIVNYLKDPGTKAHAEIFLNACLAHDMNYAAPWTEIGWKDGRLMCERILFYDMQRTIETSDMNEARRGVARIVASTWYNFLEPGVVNSSLGIVKTEPFNDGQNANRNQGYRFSNIKKGGLLSVWNESGLYVMGVEVTYTDATGKKINFSERQPIRKTIVVPLSIGARNITITCYAVAGVEIFKKTFASPVTMRWSIGGTSLIPSYKENP